MIAMAITHSVEPGSHITLTIVAWYRPVRSGVDARPKRLAFHAMCRDPIHYLRKHRLELRPQRHALFVVTVQQKCVVFLVVCCDVVQASACPRWLYRSLC